MYLKRIADENGKYTQVEILRMSETWRVPPRRIEQGVAEGWASLGRGAFTLHTPDGDVVFDITAPPDKAKGYIAFDLQLRKH